jgi:hypothetical protein
MSAYHSALFQTYVRNLQRIYWVEFIEAQTEMLNARTSPPGPSKDCAPAKRGLDQNCLTSAYDYFRHRRF